MGNTPPSAPAEAPKVPIPAPAEKITLEVKDKLADLKSRLEIKTADPAKQIEIAKIEEFFKQKKDEILTISKTSIDSLKKDIEDSNNSLGELKVKDGELVHTEAPGSAESEATTTENTPNEPVNPETPVNLGNITTQVPESYQKEVKNYIVDNGGFAGMVRKGISNWIVEIIKGIKGFFATFGIEDEGEKKDALAQINGFEDAEEERRVTASVKALKSSPVTKGPPLSDLLKINHISNEDLTKMLKDNPGLDFSSTKNIEAAFTGKYKHSGDREPMRRYDRIFITLADIHDTIDPSEPYNATNKFKEILSGSNNTDLDDRIPETESVNPAPLIAPILEPLEEDSTSPEVQTELRAKAVSLDGSVTKAQTMPEGTAEEKNTKELAVKSAQESVKKFKEERKNTILGEYADIQERIKQTEIDLKILTDTNSPEESEMKKRRAVEENLRKLKTIEAAMKTKIEEVLTRNGDEWDIKDDINAEKMASVETVILAIENNTASVENKELSEEEKKKQEKMVSDLEIEVQNTLYGGSKNWKEDYKIDKPEDIEQLEKKISDIKSLPSNDILKEKITGIEKKIQTARLKIEAVKAFLMHARGLVKNENEIPDYGDWTGGDWFGNDFIHPGDIAGEIEIDTEATGFWGELGTTWADEVWKLSDSELKISNALGGDQEFVYVIKANIEGLRKNTGLFAPKKGSDKFTILG